MGKSKNFDAREFKVENVKSTKCDTRTQLHLEHTKHGVVRHEVKYTNVKKGSK